LEAISYKLPVFEGPLDMLLYLVQKHKLDICDIPIAELLAQYLATIREMRSYNMEIAAEFLEMAARLVYIKSAMLLPKHEEADELRAELTGELVEYQLCQEMAAKLAAQGRYGESYVRCSGGYEPDYTYKRTHRAAELQRAYLAAAGRGRRRLPPPVQSFRRLVSRQVVSVSTRIIYVLRRLRQREQIPYQDLFVEADSKSALVATFLALLELMKAKRIWVDGEEHRLTVRAMAGAGGLSIDEGYVSEFERGEDKMEEAGADG